MALTQLLFFLFLIFQSFVFPVFPSSLLSSVFHTSYHLLPTYLSLLYSLISVFILLTTPFIDFPKHRKRKMRRNNMGLQWEMIIDGACVCVYVESCINLYALFSVVRQKALEKWIVCNIWWFIISLCLQQLTDHWGCVCVLCKYNCTLITRQLVLRNILVSKLILRVSFVSEQVEHSLWLSPYKTNVFT